MASPTLRSRAEGPRASPAWFGGSRAKAPRAPVAGSRTEAPGASARAPLLARRVALVALVTSLALLVSLGRASAQPVAGVPGEVLVVLGSTQAADATSDAQLDKLEALRKPPFDSFPKKTLLLRAQVKLEVGKEAEVELPNGRRLRLSLLERLKDGRFRISLSINKPGQRDYLPVMTVAAAAGDPFFVAGQKYDGGTLIIGVRVGSKQ